MSKQELNVTVTTAQIGLAKKLDGVVSVLGSETMQGFERAFQIANAIQE